VHYGIDEPYDPKLDLKDFVMPNTDFLEDWEKKNVKVTNSELVANKDRIVETLRNYGIDIVEITASPGPTVTLYEIKPAPGIRIAKIKSLENDIALSLAALGIRIIAPIPGKGTIGIEVPNTNPQIVSMKTMLTSDAFINSKAELPVAFGKTISNDVFVTDLAKMPHLLMAGATGTGKSVGLNAVIASLLYKKHPAELKFVMVDPKKVELSLYNAIERHYLAKLPDSDEAIITDVKKVVRTLNSLCIEMDQRYDLLKAAKVRNIQEYNPKFINRQLNPEHGHRYLPYIVLVIDEFADLIMTAGKEVELPICRLAQLARAVGIHLIIATQRPTTNIITGAIKANFPARIAFRVISAIDSRTILDVSGANQLIGRGDMLISLAGKDLVRCQCALIETNEIERLARFIGEQRGYPDGEGFLLPEYLDENDEPNKEFDAKAKDEFFNDAARLVVASQFGSTSLLQRKLSLGYNRAGRIIDQLEAAGIVGPYNGSKARDVLIKDEVALEEMLKNL
jgi:S-DNA-T family DNA segregation ATPase FtsK/SpoIIIE